MRPPPGYPFAGPLPSRPPPAQGADDGNRRHLLGLAGFIFAFSATMMALGFLSIALLVHHVHPPIERLASLAPQITFETDSTPRESVAPRNIPAHPARFLEGCSPQELDALEETLGASIARGAPLYNEGDADGCVEEYENTARMAVSSLPTSCAGPAKALAQGLATAATLDGARGRAWAMRDAFDGLLEAIAQTHGGGASSL